VRPFDERYTLRLPLGENDLGSIWTAQDNDSGASVAVVMLEAETDEAVRARFRDHAERLLGVTHPNVVRALDRGDTADGTPYLVLELLEGESLAVRFGQSALRVDRAVEWLVGASEGLGALHAAGIAHGDVEPGNVFLAGPKDKEVAKIIGLALNRADARAGREAAARTSLSSLQQGYAYAAPEQLRGEVQASPAADLYSLGAVAYAVLAGRPPFVAPDAASLRDAVRTKRPPALGAVKRELASYATILDRALAADPARRFTDGPAFARALKTCLLMSRATAALALPAGPRSPIGESDAVDLPVTTKPTLGVKASVPPKAAPVGASEAAKPAATKPLAAPRALGARPLPKPSGGVDVAQAGAPAASSLAAPNATHAEVSVSETMSAVDASLDDGVTPASPEITEKEGDDAAHAVPVEVSDPATTSADAASPPATMSAAAPSPAAPSPAAPSPAAAASFRDQSEVTTVKGASSPGTSAESAPVVAAPALDDVSEVATVQRASSPGTTVSPVESAPVVAAPALDDVSEVTTVKGASPSDEMELSEVSEVSEVSAVLIAPPTPPTVPRVDAPELRATPREVEAASPKRIDTRDGVESIAGPVAEPIASRPPWLVPAMLAAAVLLGVGVWSLTRGDAPADAAPETADVAPAAEPPTSVAAEPDGVDTAVPPEPVVAPEPPPEPAVTAAVLDAGAPSVEPAPEAVAAAPEATPPATEAAPPAPTPAVPVASPATVRAPSPMAARVVPPVRGDGAAAARPAVSRPASGRPAAATRPAASRPGASRPGASRPAAAARPASGGSVGPRGARPTVISDPGF
jgi:hypothetical protein